MILADFRGGFCHDRLLFLLCSHGTLNRCDAILNHDLDIVRVGRKGAVSNDALANACGQLKVSLAIPCWSAVGSGLATSGLLLTVLSAASEAVFELFEALVSLGGAVG